MFVKSPFLEIPQYSQATVPFFLDTNPLRFYLLPLQLLQGPFNFSYVSPYHVQFPYKIEAPVPAADDKKAYIQVEKWLSDIS